MKGDRRSTAEAVLGCIVRAWGRGRGGLTDHEVGTMLKDAGLKIGRSTACVTRYTFWTACRNKRDACPEAHLPGQTHGGKRPFLHDSGLRRDTDTASNAIVWGPTPDAEATFKTLLTHLPRDTQGEN